MATYESLNKQELHTLRQEVAAQYEAFQAKRLKLDMSRGKPNADQLDLSMELLDVINSTASLKAEDGTDCRNYGVLDGLPEAKRLMAGVMGCQPENVIVYGNSSLTIMYDTVSRSVTHGVMGSTPWCKLEKVKFLCPSPGYDRHFSITEFFGIEMIPVPMTPTGPEMDLVEKLVSQDSAIKGIWCVPLYSNPQGISYSDETVRRFARLKPAASDFRIYWDNAYAVHHLHDDHQEQILEILAECEQAGNPDMVFEFCSTSKITFPGAGIAAIAASKDNLTFIRKQMSMQSIGHDKINQLRHVRYFQNFAGLEAHMKNQAERLRPKFSVVLDTLERGLTSAGIGSWTKPLGGYFVSFDALPGCAKAIVAKCKEAGLVLTEAGATFPYHNDPQDSNIRIAPTYPFPDELAIAGELFVLCVKLVSIDKLLEQK